MSPSPLPRPARQRGRSVRRAVPVAVLALAAAGLVPAVATPAEAAGPIGVTPSRTIPTTTFGGLAIASDGTIYAAVDDRIDAWSPTSDGEVVVAKSFTDVAPSGPLALSPSAGLAYVDRDDAAVVVLDPGQAGGAAVPTRSISGPSTQLDDPGSLTWTPSGALWVVDVAPDGSIELLRFAPGASGDVAPVRRVSGPRTRLTPGVAFPGGPSVAGLPSDGVAVSPPGLKPQYSVFTAGQSGNVAPQRIVKVSTPSPQWLAQGVAADPQGRVYLGSGDLGGDHFGRLDVFGPAADGYAKPLVTLGDTQQRFQVPMFPTVAANGTLALVDASLLLIGGGGGGFDAEIQVFKPLLGKPGAPTSVSVTKSSSTATVAWKAASNPSGTPLTYRVVVAKGTKTLVSKTVSGRTLALKRSSLPSGTLKVTVSAVNVGGTSPGASKAFTR